MYRAISCAICIALASVSWAQQTGAELTLSEQVKQLVQQLNSDQLEKRQAAENALVDLGIDALDELPMDEQRLPQEAKSRLARVRERLEKEAAKVATQPATLTLKGQYKLSEILDKILELTDNRVIDYRNQVGQTATDPQLDVDFEEAPFWEVLDYVMQQSDLMIDPYSGGTRTLALVDAGGQQATGDRIAYGGLFRFDPQALRAVRNLRNPSNHQLTLTIEITWEPRVLPLAISHPVEKLRVVDEEGNSIAVNSELPALESSVQNEVSSIEVDLPLELPSREVHQIASLEGEILALVPGRDATFKFENIQAARNVERSSAGVKVILQRVRKNAGVQQVRMLVRFGEASGALESHRGWIYSNKAYLVSPEGKQINVSSFETTRQQINEVGLAYNFVIPSVKGYSFVYKTPAAIVQMPVKYELKDILLP